MVQAVTRLSTRTMVASINNLRQPRLCPLLALFRNEGTMRLHLLFTHAQSSIIVMVPAVTVISVSTKEVFQCTVARPLNTWIASNKAWEWTPDLRVPTSSKEASAAACRRLPVWPFYHQNLVMQLVELTFLLKVRWLSTASLSALRRKWVLISVTLMGDYLSLNSQEIALSTRNWRLASSNWTEYSLRTALVSLKALLIGSSELFCS